MDSKHKKKGFRLSFLVLSLLGFSLASSLLATDDLIILNNNRLLADVLEGTVVHESMIITNTTQTPLKINNIRPTCGCTIMSNAEYTIGPSATASIKFDFKSANYSGKIDRRIMLTTTNQTYTFEFSIKVRPLLELSSTSIDIGEYQTDQIIQRKVDIIQEKRTPEIILDYVYANTNFIKIIMEKDKNGKNSLSITCQPKGSDIYTQNVSLGFRSGETKKNIPLYITGQRKK